MMKSVDPQATDLERLLSICLLEEEDTLVPADNGKKLSEKISMSWSATIDGLCRRFARDDSFDDTDDAQPARFEGNACILDREAELFRLLSTLVGAPAK
jgi:hypothetical protein